MHPIHDVDVSLLLALSLCSKRRPADLTEVMAAADLILGTIPGEAKLSEAFARLSLHGLISGTEGAYSLTPDAEKVMAGQPRQTDLAKRVFRVKEKLSAYTPTEEYPALQVSAEAIGAAILAHRAAGALPVKNLLMPKPKAAVEKRPGWRKHPGGRGPRRDG